MAVKDFTYDQTKVKINLNGLPITDLMDPVTVQTDGDDWTTTEGVGDNVIFNKRIAKTATVTLPMNPVSPEYAAIRGFRTLDNETGAGPFPFAFVDLNNGETILGKARIMNLGEKSYATEATARNVTLKVVKSLEA